MRGKDAGVSLTGKVVLVTGAGSGIGRAVTHTLIAAGASVILFGRREALLKQVSGEVIRACCHQPGPRALVVPVDVAVPAAVSCGVATGLREFGRLDGLVNNAGLARFGAIDEIGLDDIDSMIDVNLRGPVHLIRACLPALRDSGGSIVNVTSVGGLLAMPGRSCYGATKAALNSLTRSLARELAPGVRVNAVLPGPVETPMYSGLGLTAEETGQLRRDLLAGTPMGRFGQPEEVARWVCSLLDDELSSWVTGALIPVDGGRTA